jgi:hypothetical protein
MLIKSIFGLALFLILAAVGWRYMGPDPSRKPAAAMLPLPAAISFEGRPSEAATPPRAPPVEEQAAGTVRGVRKCKKGSTVIYTDQICPKGMQDLRVVERELTVLPSTPVPKTVKSPLQPDGNGSANAEPSIRAKQMDRLINQ